MAEGTPPELLPPDLSSFVASKCKGKFEGFVQLSLVVDANGRARNITFLQPLGTDLDRAAIGIAELDRFKPGMRGGQAVAVAQLLALRMRGCAVESKDAAGKKRQMLRLKALPEQRLSSLVGDPVTMPLTPEEDSSNAGQSSNPNISKVGGPVKAPVILRSVEATFTDQARRNKINGYCVLSLLVDRHGLPQDVRVVRPLGYGLDENAVQAVNLYRFKPATLNGMPVPVVISVEVTYRIY